MRFRATAVVLLSIALLVPSVAAATEEWEQWSGLAVSGTVSEGTVFKCSSSVRKDDGASHHYYTLLDFGFDRRVTPALVLGAYYTHVNSGGADAWQVEYRPHLDATLSARLGPVALSDRNRLELRFKGGEDSARYRNRLKISLRTLGPLDVRPYVAVEPFYDFKQEELNKNRSYVGARFGLWGRFSADVYYMYESRKRAGEWSGVPVVGTTLAFSF